MRRFTVKDATPAQQQALRGLLEDLAKEFTKTFDTEQNAKLVQATFKDSLRRLVSNGIIPEDHGLELEVQRPSPPIIKRRPLDPLALGIPNTPDNWARMQGFDFVAVEVAPSDYTMKLRLTSADERE